MSNDMFPDPLIKLMLQDQAKKRMDNIFQQAKESAGGTEALMAKAQADVLIMEQVQRMREVEQDYERRRQEYLNNQEPPLRMLFIGGPNDGQWKAVEKVIPVLKVAVYPNPGFGPGDVLPNGTPNLPIHTEEYKLVRVGMDNTGIYLHESIEYRDLMDHLLAGYKGAMEGNRYATD